MNVNYEISSCNNVDLTAFWAEAVKAKSILAWIVEQSAENIEESQQAATQKYTKAGNRAEVSREPLLC